jgi:hypothetical protein
MSATRDYLTIVSGLPRSGTSMMMRMLEAGGLPALTDNIRTADEDNPRGYYEFEPVKQTKKDDSWLADTPGRCVKMVYRLLYDLPTDREYRVVFMQRNLDEVIASQNVMLERKGKSGGVLPEEKLRSMFEGELGKCADWLASQSAFRTLYVNYNEVLVDPAPAIARLNDFLDGQLDTAAMARIIEPQLYRQRQE